jgi:hypothetical protein
MQWQLPEYQRSIKFDKYYKSRFIRKTYEITL